MKRALMFGLLLGVSCTSRPRTPPPCPDRSCRCTDPPMPSTWVRMGDDVRFEAGSSALDEHAERTTDQIVALLRARPLVLRIDVLGRGDHTGEGRNQAGGSLAERRVLAVRAALRSRGIPERMLAPPEDLDPVFSIDARHRTAPGLGAVTVYSLLPSFARGANAR